MKRFIKLTSVALLTLVSLAAVAEDNGKKAAPPTEPPAQVDQQLTQMQQRMQIMQSQMDQLAKTQDPKERQRLLDEHWATMQKTMTTMHGAWGAMMGGQMMGGQMMWKDYRELTPEQLRERQYKMDRWMPMHQMMMDQMMQHQRAMMLPAPTAPPTK